jgi:hypothetical protein
MEMWQRLESLNKSRDFVLGKVTRNRGRVMDVVPSED